MGYRGGRRAGLGFVIAGADNGTYSATLAVHADDAELRAHLLDADRFEASLPLFREMAPVVARQGTPITDVQTMGGLINRHPSFRRRRRRAAHARVLRDRRRAHVHEPGVRPRVLARRAAGRARVPTRSPRIQTTWRRPRRGVRSGERGTRRALVRDVAADRQTRGREPRGFDLQSMRRAAASDDPEIAVLMTKMMSLLITPQEVFGDPDVVGEASNGGRRAQATRPCRSQLQAADTRGHPRARP